MYNGTMVLDIHGHVVSPPAFSALAQRLTILRTPTAEPFRMDDELVEKYCQEHLRYLDDRDIDVQFVSPRPVSMMHWETPTLQRNWCRATNDLLAQQHRLHPDRIWGVAQLPQTVKRDTSVCIDELERCFTELNGFVGAVVNPDPGGDNQYQGMNDEAWFPLYEKAQELKTPLIVHASISRDPRITIIPHNYQYNFMTEQSLATLLLENSDVFERYPELRVIICHCGGTLSRFIPRAESSGIAGGGQVGIGTRAPAAHVEEHDWSDNLFFDTCSYDQDFLETALKQRGVDQMMFGTEAPGSGTGVLNPDTGKPADDMVPVIDRISFLTADDKRKLFRDTTLRVFALYED